MESATYSVRICFGTEQGELPTMEEMERLISDQLAGPLDERTGLEVFALTVDSVTDELL